MIHGFSSESANVFDLEAFDLLQSFAERAGPAAASLGSYELKPVAWRASAPTRVSTARLAAFTALFFLFGAAAPIAAALRGARAVERAADPTPGLALAIR